MVGRGLQGLGPPPVLLLTCSSLPLKELGKDMELSCSYFRTFLA